MCPCFLSVCSSAFSSLVAASALASLPIACSVRSFPTFLLFLSSFLTFLLSSLSLSLHFSFLSFLSLLLCTDLFHSYHVVSCDSTFGWPGLSDDDHTLPIRQGPKLYASNDASRSGTGTPMGFQRYPQNKHLEGALGDGAARPRYPSPQPTHLGIPGTSPHRVLSEEDPGYIAAKFEGKQVQMEQGEL